MKQELKDQARSMRQQGASIGQIATSLKVAKSSVSIWVRDILLTEDQSATLKSNKIRYGIENKGGQTNRNKNLDLRKKYQEEGRAGAQEMRLLHMIGCMLYWAEGAKTRNGIYFVNSDSNMVTLFLRFLREEMNVSDSEIALRIHCHSHDLQEIKSIELFWCDLLKLPITNLRQTYIKEGSTTRHNRLANGVCDIRVHRTDLVQHIFGAIQEYGGFDNPDWLF